MAGDTRRRAVDAARDLIVEGGLSALSMRKVARVVDVSAAALYRHFDDKQALIWAAVDEGFRLFADYLTSSLGEPEPLSRFRASGEGYFRFAADHPEFYRVIFGTALNDGALDDPPEAVSRRADATLNFLVDRIRECRQAGVFPRRADGDPIDAHAQAIILWAQHHGVVMLRIDGRLSSLDDPAFAALVRHHLQQQERALTLA